MKLLCIDLSTHAGFSLMEGNMGEKPILIKHGTIHLGKNVHEFGTYPFSYFHCATAQLDNLIPLMRDERPDVIVVEETNGGRNRYTQKLLEFLHYSLVVVVAGYIEEYPEAKLVYLDSSEWRHNLGLKMTKEQKKANAKLRKAMREASSEGKKVDKKALGIKGLTNPKHVAVAHANTTFGLQLKMKDNDAADAICLGLAYFNNAVPCDGV